MKKIIGAWIIAITFGFCCSAFAFDPADENLSGDRIQKHPGNSLIVRVDANGDKKIFSIDGIKKLTEKQIATEIKKLSKTNSSDTKLEKISFDPETEDLDSVPSWYYRGGHNHYRHGYYNRYHHGYNHWNHYGYYNHNRYYNNYTYNYGYYYRPYYNYYYWNNCNWYYYY